MHKKSKTYKTKKPTKKQTRAMVLCTSIDLLHECKGEFLECEFNFNSVCSNFNTFILNNKIYEIFIELILTIGKL